MMLTQRMIAPYLLRQGLVSIESFVDGDLVVADISQRNRNFKVISEQATSYLCKQGVTLEGTETVAREAVVYEHLSSSVGGFDRYLPRFFGYDPEAQILIIEFFREAENLREYHAHRGRFPVAVAATLGAALGTLHRLNWVQDGLDADRFKLQPPWILSIHRPSLGLLQHLSSANLQAIKIIQRFPEFCELFDALRREWIIERLIHFDIKWDNCLIVAGRSASRKIDLRIVDWELAGVGDPCWDVGGVFNDYLSFWLNSIPITGETPPERFVEIARYPISKMQPAIRSFWESYVRHMELDAATSVEWLLRAVKYAAARLTQTAYEYMYNSMTLTGNVVCFLQVSLNILQRPHEAIVRLLGIPLQGEIF